MPLGTAGAPRCRDWRGGTRAQGPSYPGSLSMGVGAEVHQVPSCVPQATHCGTDSAAAYLLGVLSTGTLVKYFEMFTEKRGVGGI